jgi:5-(carboxyamino)imidazole ribonucleotide synthase
MHVGILGAGQLGRMLVLAGVPLGMRFRLYDRVADAPGGAVAPLVTGDFDDRRALARFARGLDVVTFDWENVPVDSTRRVAAFARVAPSPTALAVAQDRWAEKRLFSRLDIPAAPSARVDRMQDLERAARRIGLPGIVKTRRLGYDGKGQVVVRQTADLAVAWARLQGQPSIYERMLRFRREVSLVAVRGRDGSTAFYPLAENAHRDGILSVSRAPYLSPSLQRLAEEHARRILRHLRYVGVLCVEFFVTRDGLVANEIAPRVHNSGHWTIEGAETSQFENHLRAIAGLPLGETRARGHCAMVNFVGRMPPRGELLSLPGVHLHDYCKAPRPGRKLGHATFVGRTRRERDLCADRLLRHATR